MLSICRNPEETQETARISVIERELRNNRIAGSNRAFI